MNASYRNSDVLFQHAATLHDQGRVDLAMDQLRKVLAIDPDNANAHALFCMCECKLNRLAEAERWIKQALRLDPESGFVHYAYSIVLYRQKKGKAAEKALDEAIRLQPDCANYFFRLAAIKTDQGRPHEAIAAAERGLEIDPEHADCASLRALALARLKRWREAREAIDQALALNPESDYVHAAAGWKLVSQGLNREARDHFREALRINAENTWALAGLKIISPYGERPGRFLFRLLIGGFALCGPSTIVHSLMKNTNVNYSTWLGFMIPLYAGSLMLLYAIFIVLHIFIENVRNKTVASLFHSRWRPGERPVLLALGSLSAGFALFVLSIIVISQSATPGAGMISAFAGLFLLGLLLMTVGATTGLRLLAIRAQERFSILLVRRRTRRNASKQIGPRL